MAEQLSHPPDSQQSHRRGWLWGVGAALGLLVVAATVIAGNMGTMPKDVQTLAWAAEQLGIGVSTAYRLAKQDKIPGAFKVGNQWRVSVPAFMREVHGGEEVA
jgi:excisionase family DNA binding protein